MLSTFLSTENLELYRTVFSVSESLESTCPRSETPDLHVLDETGEDVLEFSKGLLTVGGDFLEGRIKGYLGTELLKTVPFGAFHDFSYFSEVFFIDYSGRARGPEFIRDPRSHYDADALGDQLLNIAYIRYQRIFRERRLYIKGDIIYGFFFQEPFYPGGIRTVRIGLGLESTLLYLFHKGWQVIVYEGFASGYHHTFDLGLAAGQIIKDIFFRPVGSLLGRYQVGVLTVSTSEITSLDKYHGTQVSGEINKRQFLQAGYHHLLSTWSPRCIFSYL